jgi:hypothetical protein
MKKFLLAAAIAACLSSQALAVINLQITEIWPGQADTDVTKDWFEITNYGDSPWVSGVDSPIFVNDSGGDILTTSAEVFGLANILPNESVVVLMEGDTGDKQEFFDVWDPVIPQVLSNIGYADGSGLGLGQPADGVRIVMNNTLLDAENYSGSGVFNNGQSWDVALTAYSLPGNASGAQATLVGGGADLDAPAIGSPGSVAGVPNVPEPGSLVLAVIALLGATLSRR